MPHFRRPTKGYDVRASVTSSMRQKMTSSFPSPASSSMASASSSSSSSFSLLFDDSSESSCRARFGMRVRSRRTGRRSGAFPYRNELQSVCPIGCVEPQTIQDHVVASCLPFASSSASTTRSARHISHDELPSSFSNVPARSATFQHGLHSARQSVVPTEIAHPWRHPVDCAARQLPRTQAPVVRPQLPCHDMRATSRKMSGYLSAMLRHISQRSHLETAPVLLSTRQRSRAPVPVARIGGGLVLSRKRCQDHSRPLKNDNGFCRSEVGQTSLLGRRLIVNVTSGVILWRRRRRRWARAS